MEIEAPRRAVIYGGTENIVRELEKKLGNYGFVLEEHIVCHQGRQVRVPSRAEVLLVIQDMVPTDAVPAVKAAAAQRRLPFAAITRKWATSLRILLQSGLASESEQYWPTDKPVEPTPPERGVRRRVGVIADREPTVETRAIAKVDAGFAPEAVRDLVGAYSPAEVEASLERVPWARDMVEAWAPEQEKKQELKEELNMAAQQSKSNPTPPPVLPEEIKSAMKLLKDELTKAPNVSRVYFQRAGGGDIEVQFEILQPIWGVL